jgi:dGTPase
MEVAQIARDMARTLRLNEDLAECIALAHDLGHSPFGHRGEEALHHWCERHELRFEHNAQSLRIVTLLEQHSPLAKGLNLNREVLEGLQKHREVWTDAPFERGLTMESQTVDRADEIAYLGHDCDDGLKAELFTLREIFAVPLAAEAGALAKNRSTSLRGAIIHLLVTDLYQETERLVKTQNIRSLTDVYASTVPLVDFSASLQSKVKELRQFLRLRMYEHPRVVQAGEEGQRIITQLCESYASSPPSKVTFLQKQTNGSLPEAVKDYVAGMTDAFAKAQTSILPT